MKYSISSTKPVKSFNRESAIEALAATVDRLGVACEGLAAAERAAFDCAQVLDDCSSALESISKFGITQANMSILNGSDHNLDRALGLEDLAIASIESLSETTKKALKKSYEAGLEGKIAEYWERFKEMLRKIWAWIKRFFSELFDRNAKTVRLLNEAVKSKTYAQDMVKKFSSDKEYNVLDKAQLNKAFDLAEALIPAMKVGLDGKVTPPAAQALSACGIESTRDGALKTGEEFDKIFKKNPGKLKQLFGSASDFQNWVSRFGKIATSAQVQEDLKTVDNFFSGLIKDAENAKDEAAQKKLREEKGATMTVVKSYVMLYNKIVGMIGGTLDAVVL